MAESKSTVESLETDLEIDEKIDQQETGWKIQKVGWVLMLAIMLFGALGLFGGGPLSGRTLTSGPVKAEVDNFYRYETEFKILVESGVHISSITFDQEYLKDFSIVRFVPDIANNITKDNKVIYNFLPGDNRIVSIYFIPKHFGKVKGTMKVNENNHFKLSHFIYP